MADDTSHLFITLYTDADVHGGLAAQLRRRGFDVISAYEAGNANLDDEAQLTYAVEQGRALLTCNARHFVPLVAKWYQAKRSHYGIIVSEQLPVGEMVRRVSYFLNTVSADEMRDGFRNLGEFAE